MGLIASAMWLWLVLTIGLILGMYFYHKRKIEGNKEGTVDFSNATMFFDPIKGEGDLFIGGILSLFFFSMFLFEFISNIRRMFIT